MKKLSVLLLIVLLALVAAVPASAAPPVIETGDYDVTYLFEEATAVCEFDIWVHAVGSWQLTTFYDNDGNPTGIKSHDRGIDELYRPETPDVKLIGNYTANYFEDWVTGSWSAPGTYWSITVPGYGTVLKEAGLWKVPHPGRLVGIHTSYDPAKMALFCSLLSGG
jgi:hypothetical protein